MKACWWRTLGRRPRPLLRARRCLSRDLAAWVGLCASRRALAQQAARRGIGIDAQALAQKLPVDRKSFKLHERCARFISRHRLRRGVLVGSFEPPASTSVLPVLRDWSQVHQLPKTEPRRAVATDALSFPLTAALALSVAEVAILPGGTLFLLLLGPELGSELRAEAKWFQMLHYARDTTGQSLRSAHIAFVGPRVPERLHSCTKQLTDNFGRKLLLTFARGVYHAPDIRQSLAKHGTPHLAVAFNSGLAEHACPSLSRAIIGPRLNLMLVLFVFAFATRQYGLLDTIHLAPCCHISTSYFQGACTEQILF
ncbi:MAG: hypothetical protein SGPRY_006405 [Prymnesium sp.]